MWWWGRRVVAQALHREAALRGESAASSTGASAAVDAAIAADNLQARVHLPHDLMGRAVGSPLLEAPSCAHMHCHSASSTHLGATL